MSKNQQSSLFGALCLIAQPILLNALSIPATAYIIRNLGPSKYGQWVVAVSLVAAISFLANLGLRTLFVRTVSRDPGLAAEGLAEQLGLRTLLAILATCLAVSLAYCLHYPLVILYCVGLAGTGFIISSMVTALADLLQALQLLKAIAAVNLAAGLVLTACSVFAVWRGTGPVGLSAAYLSGPLTSLLLLLAFVSRRLFPVRFSWNVLKFRELLYEVRSLSLWTFFGSLHDRVQQLVIPKMIGVTAYGYLSAGTIPVSRLQVVPDGLVMYFYPTLSRTYTQNREVAAKQVAKFITMSLIVCVPLAVIVTFLARPISIILFPAHASICCTVIDISIWALPLSAFLQPLLSATQAAGKHVESGNMLTWATIASSVLCIFLVREWGILGACYSWITSYFLSLLFLLPLFMQTFPHALRDVPVGKIALCTAAMVIILRICTVPNTSFPLVWLVAATIALIAYFAILAKLRVFDFHELLQMFRRPSTLVVE